jgi:UDP-2,3-diacylglucosamine hydrolase
LKSRSDRPVYLISDLHLDAGRPETVRLLFDFLNGPARRARALYVLGDLFEAWIGDDAPGALGQSVADELSKLGQTGVSVFFMAGNRDFLVGDTFCDRAGMTRLEEPCSNPPMIPEAVLMHGDTLCTDDLAYQRFRKKVRNPDWQRQVLSRPIWWRRLLARLARSISRFQNRNKPAAIMDVNEQAVVDVLREYPGRILIHGHTHRPAIHQIEVDGQARQRVVLGDWHEDRGSVIRMVDGQLELLVLGRDRSGSLKMEKTLS